MNSVFTDSYAAYLFIILAIAMTICGFIFATKGGKWLFYVAMTAWLMAAFYCFSVQSSLLSLVHMLGALFALVALACALMPIYAFKTKAEEIQEEDSYARMARRIETMRNKTESFKPKGKDIIL